MRARECETRRIEPPLDADAKADIVVGTISAQTNDRAARRRKMGEETSMLVLREKPFGEDEDSNFVKRVSSMGGNSSDRSERERSTGRANRRESVFSIGRAKSDNSGSFERRTKACGCGAWLGSWRGARGGGGGGGGDGSSLSEGSDIPSIPAPIPTVKTPPHKSTIANTFSKKLKRGLCVPRTITEDGEEEEVVKEEEGEKVVSLGSSFDAGTPLHAHKTGNKGDGGPSTKVENGDVVVVAIDEAGTCTTGTPSVRTALSNSSVEEDERRINCGPVAERMDEKDEQQQQQQQQSQQMNMLPLQAEELPACDVDGDGDDNGNRSSVPSSARLPLVRTFSGSSFGSPPLHSSSMYNVGVSWDAESAYGTPCASFSSRGTPSLSAYSTPLSRGEFFSPLLSAGRTGGASMPQLSMPGLLRSQSFGDTGSRRRSSSPVRPASVGRWFFDPSRWARRSRRQATSMFRHSQTSTTGPLNDQYAGDGVKAYAKGAGEDDQSEGAYETRTMPMSPSVSGNLRRGFVGDAMGRSGDLIGRQENGSGAMDEQRNRNAILARNTLSDVADLYCPPSLGMEEGVVVDRNGAAPGVGAIDSGGSPRTALVDAKTLGFSRDYTFSLPASTVLDGDLNVIKDGNGPEKGDRAKLSLQQEESRDHVIGSGNDGASINLAVDPVRGGTVIQADITKADDGTVATAAGGGKDGNNVHKESNAYSADVDQGSRGNEKDSGAEVALGVDNAGGKFRILDLEATLAKLQLDIWENSLGIRDRVIDSRDQTQLTSSFPLPRPPPSGPGAFNFEVLQTPSPPVLPLSIPPVSHH